MGVHEAFPGTAPLNMPPDQQHGTCNKHGTGLGGYVRGTEVDWVLSKQRRWACRKYMYGLHIQMRYENVMGVHRTE